ncbi:MAG: alginate lyase family protein [Acidobacteriota bacterium]
MQSLRWYARRLRQMTPAEVIWRGRSTIRDTGDRIAFALRLYPSLLEPGSRDLGEISGAALLCPLPAGAWASAAPLSPQAAWAADLREQADDLIAHRFTFMNLERVHLGDPIDWNRDHETGTPSPRGYAGAIDYRDPATAGDCKLVWEPNRHLHLVVLGRAYRATGEVRYVRAALEHLDSWMQQCPIGTGMNWRSPLELAIRVINWTWLIGLAEPSGLITGPPRARLLHALNLHVQDVARKFSRGSSANNHRIGEAAGVFIATSCLPGLTGAAVLRQTARNILCDEILAQHHPDGGNREQAFAYQLFVLQFLLLAGFVADRTGQPMPPAYRERLARIVDFTAALSDAGPAPFYGDDDEGYVLDLGGRGEGGRQLVAAGRVLLDPSARDANLDQEPVHWLFGEPASPAGAAAGSPDAPALTSRALEGTGLYLLQWGRRGAVDSASATFDCAELGFGPLAAHGHADALSVTLRAFGRDILVDPGTYDYFRYPEWRDYFRSTRAHSTIAIDDQDQSVMLGAFMWGGRAAARCVEWWSDAEITRVVGEHDGYTRLPDPVRHRRALEMDPRRRTFLITDTLLMDRAHRVALYFHIAEDARVTRSGERDFTVTVPEGEVGIEIDPQLAVATLHGSDAPIGGWVSRRYHRKTASLTIVATTTAPGPLTLRSRLTVQPGGAH